MTQAATLVTVTNVTLAWRFRTPSHRGKMQKNGAHTFRCAPRTVFRAGSRTGYLTVRVPVPEEAVLALSPAKEIVRG